MNCNHIKSKAKSTLSCKCRKHFYIELTEDQKESILRSIKESKEEKNITEIELENRIKEKFGF